MHIEEGNGGDRQASSFAHGLNATLGLVIHGAADGIALGASSLSGNGSLGLVVFLAVLVHKGKLITSMPGSADVSGPTALGLTTTLMSLNLTPPQIRRRLLIFSFAAPLGAVITFFLVKLFGVSGQHNAGEIDSLGWWTGIALLFSVSRSSLSVPQNTRLMSRVVHFYMSLLSFNLYRMMPMPKGLIQVDMLLMRILSSWGNTSVRLY